MKNIPEIDFVITWLNGGDEAWLKEKSKYEPVKGTDDRPERYRDWGIIKYWFRGVEKYAPWVRKIHFVTWGHLPEWIDVNNPKLNIVYHQDFIPEEYRPTFNCIPIELNFHRIKDLAENFVYFNDDMAFLQHIKPTDLFVDGKPCDMLALQPVVANPKNTVMSHLLLNDALVLSKHFTKRQNILSQPGKYFKIGYPIKYFVYNMLELAFPLFTGFYTVHGPFPFCKSMFEEIWEKEPEEMDRACHSKFRSSTDVTPYVIREWQKLKGEFHPRNVKKDLAYFNVESENQKVVAAIRKHKRKFICINDANDKIDFEKANKEILQAFEEAFPDKSSFEL